MVAVAVSHDITEPEITDLQFDAPAAPDSPPADPLHAYLSHLPRSRAARAYADLARAAAFLCGGHAEPAGVPWHFLRPEQGAVLRAWASFCHPPRTANAILTALRGVVRWAEHTGSLPAEDAHALTRALGRLPATNRIARGLSSRTIEWLLAVCDDGTPISARDATILALMALGGLRIAEIAALQWSDFDPDRALLFARPGSRAAGRALILSDALIELLDAWHALAPATDGPIFASLGAGAVSRPLSRSGVAAVVHRRARQAGLSRLRAADLSGGYWWELSRRPIESGRAPSLLVLEEGSAWLASEALSFRSALGHSNASMG